MYFIDIVNLDGDSWSNTVQDKYNQHQRQQSGLVMELKNWDGKSSNDINLIYHRHLNEVDFIEDIIRLSRIATYQKGATWLLKRFFEDDRKIDDSQSARIISLLDSLNHWEEKLHILQCLPYLNIATNEKKEIESFLRRCLTDENKFVRAWAYNGFYELSIRYPEYITETKEYFEMAMRDEAPSVKARIRNILKKGF